MHKLPDLPYTYSALEPHLDEATMRLHHTKHHQTYVDKLNAALADQPEWAALTLDNLIARQSEAPEAIRLAVRNHGGGHWNHSFFWPSLLAPVNFLPLAGELSAAVASTFGNWDNFTAEFKKVGQNHFGSGWVWLGLVDNQLKIVTTPNQDSPHLIKLEPLFGVDLWEHAYYLKYQNRRAEYLDAIFSIINWAKVSERYTQYANGRIK